MNFNAPVVTMLYAGICGVLLTCSQSTSCACVAGQDFARHGRIRARAAGAVHGNFTEYTPRS
jgi:hypothetical protein